MTPEREDGQAEMESYKRELCWSWRKQTSKQTTNKKQTPDTGQAPADGKTASQFTAQITIFPVALTVTSGRLIGSQKDAHVPVPERAKAGKEKSLRSLTLPPPSLEPGCAPWSSHSSPVTTRHPNEHEGLYCKSGRTEMCTEFGSLIASLNCPASQALFCFPV